MQSWAQQLHLAICSTSTEVMDGNKYDIMITNRRTARHMETYANERIMLMNASKPGLALDFCDTIQRRWQKNICT